MVFGAAKYQKMNDVLVSEINPELSDTAALCEKYHINLSQCANCVIIQAKRAEKVWYVACVVLASTRIDVNGTVRKYINAKKASFAPMESAVKLTGMEFGAIAPIGLPDDWQILVDEMVAETQHVIIGSGIRKSKLLVSGELLLSLPNAIWMNMTKKVE